MQPKGWEAFSIELRPVKRQPADQPAPDVKLEAKYHFLNVFLHKDIIHYEQGNIPAVVRSPGTVLERTVRWLDTNHRKVAIKKTEIGNEVMWHAIEPFKTSVYFVADQLKDAWCDLGVNPNLFEPCIDV